jgi:hypothetical protein
MICITTCTYVPKIAASILRFVQSVREFLAMRPKGIHHEAIMRHSLSLKTCKDSIPKANIRDIGPELKTRLLQTTQSFNPHFDGPKVLTRLHDLDASCTANFMLRETALPKFNMRLWMDDQTDAESCESYLAMSYRCREPLATSPPPEHLHLPTSNEVFAAVCSLVGPDEGLWFDTGCIDQADQAEKEVAISVMDILYKNAKRVIIVLWDVHLFDREAQLLEDLRVTFRDACERNVEPHMQGHGFPPYLEGCDLPELTTHPAFVDLAQKVLFSEYFERAFCGQEFRVARQCSFLLPCESDHAADKFIFYTLDFSFVATMVSSLPRALSSRPILMAVMQRLELLRGRMNNVQGVLVRKAFRNLAESQLGQSKDMSTLATNMQAALRGDSLSQIADDVFGMKAGGDPRIADEALRAIDANKDKLKLVFNSVEHPLTVALGPNEGNSPPLNEGQCLKLITKAALASDDALSLCGRGGKLDLGAGHSTWIQRPKRHQADVLSGPGSRLDRSMPFSLGTEDGDEYIDIGLQFLATKETSGSAVSAARAFLASCEAAGVPSTFTNEQNLDRTNPYPPLVQYLKDMEEIKIGTIATLFQSKDTAELSAILSTQPFSPSSHLDVEKLDAVFGDAFTLKPGVGTQPALLEPVATAFMTFVSFLVSMLQGDMAAMSYENYFWRPRGVLLYGHLCLVMAPPEAKVAVPDPVKWRECQFMSRGWLVSPRNGDDGPPHWTLESASHMYASEDFMQSLESQPQRSELCRVFGQA